MTNEQWPPDYSKIYKERLGRLRTIRSSPLALKGAKAYYRTHPVEFIEHWCDTFDPRNIGTDRPTHMPLILFKRQKELLEFLSYCIFNKRDGLIEKSRDMGATWIGCGLSVWVWLYHPGASIGWGSRKEEYVDKIGSRKSVFEKLRMIIRRLPRDFLPAGFDEKRHASFMKITNPETNAEIIGEGGDNIGRGGRTTVYLKDESAHYERPELVEAALGDNTNVQIDLSSVNGIGNVFHRRRENGQEWEGPNKQYDPTRAIVFVLDWSDHPDKDQEWYNRRREKALNEGLLAKFAQEVDRDYAASVEGSIIPHEWVKSAIDAHLKIPGLDDGGHVAALDVADGGSDTNALARRKGVVLCQIAEWPFAADPGISARMSFGMCMNVAPADLSFQYDCIGIGVGVRQEANRLEEAGAMPAHIEMAEWGAGAQPNNPKGRVIPDDPDSPINKDHYANLKAQGWWELRGRFMRTHQAVTAGVEYDPDTLISICSDLPLLRKLEKELCQATSSKNASMKLVVDKNPPGTKSPNIADAVMMCYHPQKSKNTGDLVGSY